MHSYKIGNFGGINCPDDWNSLAQRAKKDKLVIIGHARVRYGDEGLFEDEALEYCHTTMTDDQRCTTNQWTDVGKPGNSPTVHRMIGAAACLKQNISIAKFAFAGRPVDDTDEVIKWKPGANGDEYHTMIPRYSRWRRSSARDGH